MNILFCMLAAVHALAAPNIPLEERMEPPMLLSETALFQSPVANLVPSVELRSFEINQPLWVDHAKKQRYLYLPVGQKVVFSPTEAYVFPVGTILVKHFRMETARNIFQNLETRVLVRKKDVANKENWVGYTYRWDGNDARLVADRENPVLKLTIDGTAAGGARNQDFKIPNRRQCLTCHNASVGYVRSFLTGQLNRLVGNAQQLESLSRAGLFDHELGSARQYESFVPIADLTHSLESRVKTYLAVNCAHCHNPDPQASCNFVGLDFRFASFKTADLLKSGHIVPGNKNGSEIFRRMNSVKPGERMPFIGSALRDESALQAFGEWIDGLAPNKP